MENRTTYQFQLPDRRNGKIDNVPYTIFHGDKCYKGSVTIKLAIIRDLMNNGKIPLSVDYMKVEDLEV